MMRIAAQGQSESITKPTINTQAAVSQLVVEKQNSVIEEREISKETLQQAVDTVNEFLKINHSYSKFVLHDDLDRYFVQLIDAQTEEVVKEIPSRKLLDAFYEMQKLLGMIVDKKI